MNLHHIRHAAASLASQASPDRNTFLVMAEAHAVVPLVCRLTGDLTTPIRLFRQIDDGHQAFLLESVMGGERWARYSIMGRNPLFRFQAKGRESVQVDGSGQARPGPEHPYRLLSELLRKYQLPPQDPGHELPFRCGLVGYFAYDMIRLGERIPDSNPDPLNMPDIDLMLPGEVLLYDHLNQEITLICNVIMSGNSEADYTAGLGRLQELATAILLDSPDSSGQQPTAAGKDNPVCRGNSRR